MIDPQKIKRKLQELPQKEQSVSPRLPGEPTKRQDVFKIGDDLVEAKFNKGLTYQELCNLLYPDIIISTSTLHRYLTEYVKLHGLPKKPPKEKAQPPLERTKEEKSDAPSTIDADSKNLTAAQQIRMKHKHLYSQQNNNKTEKN